MGIPGVWQCRPRNAGNQLQRSSGDGICRAAMLANERPTGGHARSSDTPQSVWARNPRHRCEYITATLHQMAERRTERRGYGVSADTSAEVRRSEPLQRDQRHLSQRVDAVAIARMRNTSVLASANVDPIQRRASTTVTIAANSSRQSPPGPRRNPGRRASPSVPRPASPVPMPSSLQGVPRPCHSGPPDVWRGRP